MNVRPTLSKSKSTSIVPNVSKTPSLSKTTPPSAPLSPTLSICGDTCIVDDYKSSRTNARTSKTSSKSGSTGPSPDNQLVKLGMEPSVFCGHIKYTVGNNIVLTTAGAQTTLCAISQGDGVSNRLGDRIFAKGLSYHIYDVFTPYTAAATAQQFSSAAAAVDCNFLGIGTDSAPTTSGTATLAFTWSAANPPTYADGVMCSFAAQNTLQGNMLVVNPVVAPIRKFHRYFQDHLVKHDQNLFDNSCMSAQGGGAQIAGTLGPRIHKHEGWIPLNHIINFDTGTSNAVNNIISFIYYAKYSQATRQGGGYDNSMSFVTKLYYEDVDDDYVA